MIKERKLFEKLGLKENLNCFFKNPPESFLSEIEEVLPYLNLEESKEEFEFIMLFCRNVKEFLEYFNQFYIKVRKDGCIWICWNKKSSKYHSDLNGNIIRDVILQTDLVDNKVVSIDLNWSANRFVYRLNKRK